MCPPPFPLYPFTPTSCPTFCLCLSCVLSPPLPPPPPPPPHLFQMEMKVWVDGTQRVVCGVGEETTVQEVIMALAHALGRTGELMSERVSETERNHRTRSHHGSGSCTWQNW